MGKFMADINPQQHIDEGGEGRYANHFNVGFNAFEVILQFGQSYEGTQTMMHTRIVTSPAYADTLLQLLTQAMEQYKRSFGPIRHGRLHE
jgi:hypothetical protein